MSSPLKMATYGLDSPSKIYFFMGLQSFLTVGATMVLLLEPDAEHARQIFLGIMLCCALLFLPPYILASGSVKRKLVDRDWLLDGLSFNGNERVLDVGCGRGLLLIGAAKRLTTGRAVGLDLWTKDQSQNNPSATLENARLEGVSDKVEVLTGDAQNMPFSSNSFDLVVSSWTLHHISSIEGRQRALDEIIRVLKPGAQIAIMDMYRYDEYREYLSQRRFKNIEMLGPRRTFGMRTYLIKATKP